MPSGYTAIVCDKEVSFKEFALRCARAFGALIEFRDDSLDAELPEVIKGSSYAEDRLQEAQQRHKELLTYTKEQKAELGNKRKAELIAMYQKAIQDRQAVRARILKKISEAENWVPPTKDHKELKEFMIKQLRETLEWDGDLRYAEQSLASAEASNPNKYYNDDLVSVMSDIKRQRESVVKDQQRNAERNQWLKDLRGSL